VLTQVDDRLDPGMRDAIGVDSASLPSLMGRHPFSLLIEDPATVWNQGSERYAAVAARYEDFQGYRGRLAVDLNVVERYQDVYPTRQPVGTELFQLVHEASEAFPRVALYFEKSLLPADLAWLPSAAAGGARMEAREAGRVEVVSDGGVGLPWKGPAAVDGRPWPAGDGATVWLPAGSHVVAPAEPWAGPKLVRFNGELKGAGIPDARSLEVTYEASARAIAVLDRAPRKVRIDGVEAPLRAAGPRSVLLPGGQHTALIVTD